MPATALQLPYVKEPAQAKGKHLFRKQVLPLGQVEHPKHGTLNFTRDRLEKIVTAFRAGAYDMVPFTFNIEGNKHSDDPERVRGEVEGLELSNDGLYALVKTGDRGAELVREHPKFPVSVRLCDPGNGDFDEALAHVAATPDPVIKGMKPWEAIEASRDDEVLDLSEGSFKSSEGSASHNAISTDADTQGKDALTDEEKGALRKFFSRFGGKAPDDSSDDSGDKPTDKGDDEPKGLSDEEVEAAVKDLIADAAADDAQGDGKNGEPTTVVVNNGDKEPVAASLSKDDRKAIDMANERAEKAEVRAGKSDLNARFSNYIKEGVPPALIEAAREKLGDDKDTLLDLANEREPVAAKALFAALDAAKGTIDFSERGSLDGETVDDDEEKAKDRRKRAEEAAARYT